MTKNQMKKEISEALGFEYKSINVDSWDGGYGFIFTVRKVRYQGNTKSKSYEVIGYEF